MINTKTTVGAIMSKHLLFVRTDHDLMQACRLFSEMAIHHLPVLDQDGQLAGMLSSTDVFKALVNEDRSVNNATVEELMNRQLISIENNATIAEAASKFRKNNVHSLLVMEGQEVKGIVTGNDILRALA